MAETHVERPTRLAGGKTYCACGAPWPCEHAMPAATGTGDLTAVLGQIRDRNEQYIQARKLTEWSVSQEPCGDVRRLLAVVDGVLALAEPDGEAAYDLDGNVEQPLTRMVRCDVIREAVAAALLGETRSDEESGHAF